MKYNFNEIIDRRDTGCVKWDSPCPVSGGFAAESSPASSVLSGFAAESSPASSVLSGFAAESSPSSLPLGGAGWGILPLWVADMDFAVAPAIQEAV